MNVEGFGIEKLLLTLGIVMMLFGAKRIPEIGASLGGGIRAFKKGMRDDGDSEPAPVEPAPLAALTQRVEAPEPKRLFQPEL
jgi:sec-independent protein translocase protein TatA